jgi:hypothetical protein
VMLGSLAWGVTILIRLRRNIDAGDATTGEN